MTNPNPIPPIYGYIAQPRIDPTTGQTVYIAAGQPVLMPYVTQKGEHILVYADIPKQVENKEPPKKQQSSNGILGAISSIGNTITKASSEISREFSNAWNNVFK
ncbi:hypothetical protein M9Y10_025520 [Tritrichomonas musculus]|uniref:Uncharacterized protein n=1 Tax=Tritrichomonas musculus TaxID=1915356 RepID=A0ABR2HB93_9EUKA